MSYPARAEGLVNMINKMLAFLSERLKLPLVIFDIFFSFRRSILCWENANLRLCHHAGSLPNQIWWTNGRPTLSPSTSWRGFLVSCCSLSSGWVHWYFTCHSVECAFICNLQSWDEEMHLFYKLTNQLSSSSLLL